MKKSPIGELLCKESGLSCQVHVKDPAREDEFYRWLRELADTGLYGFNEVLTRAECESRYGLSGKLQPLRWKATATQRSRPIGRASSSPR